MRRTIIPLLFVAAAATAAFAQQPPPIPPVPPEQTLMLPGRSMQESNTPVVYKDSAEFAKYFKEIYPLIGPKNSAAWLSEHDSRNARNTRGS